MEKATQQSEITVAIVEDDSRIRTSLEEILGDDDHLQCVAVCGSAEEALEKLSGISPKVVLMDVNLPGMNGVDVLERLVKGFTYKETAADLGISYSTVKSHIEKIYKKLHVHSCAQAVAKYLTN